jgi:hypothetical protein
MPSPGNIEAVLVRFEGKLDRMIDSQNRHAEDMKLVRERLHDHANILTSLTTLNIQEKLAAIAADLKEHEHRIGLCEVDMQQRQGAAMVVKALWALVCLVGAGGIAALVKLIVSH